jgi:GNAT superfamily N-acetyltransferase
VAFVRPPSDEPIGVAVWEAAATGAAIIRLIVIHRTHRGWGLGAEAVLRMEEQVGAREVWVPIPPDNGLAVYFWLRLGYHPVLQVDQPPFARREGGLWMMRSIAGTLEQ